MTGLVGVAIERGIIRFLYGRPLETLLATYGVSLVLMQLVRSIFGDNRAVNSPAWLQGGIEVADGLVLRSTSGTYARGDRIAIGEAEITWLVGPSREEPAPSLAGFATCDEAFT